jgi:hypothetical protein
MLNSGGAVGEGVERAVIRAALKKITSQNQYWRHLDDGGHVTWALRRGGASRSRIAMAKVHGTLCALHVVWTGVLPFPVSVWMLLLVISGFPSLLDSTFLHYINPSLAIRLQAWPLDHSEVLDLDPLSPTSQVINLHLHNISVSDITWLKV